MKTNLLEQSNTGQVPEINQLWRHEKSHQIHLRIDPHVYKIVSTFQSPVDDAIFYSINLTDGKLVFTYKADQDTIILVEETEPLTVRDLIGEPK